MSSAILYLAIVAIWACVLIPRWLRRDSARGASAPLARAPRFAAEADADAGDGTPADAEAPTTRRRSRRRPLHGPQSR